MPSVISHAVVAVAAGITFAPRDVPHHFWSLSIVCSMIPDADIIGFSLRPAPLLIKLVKAGHLGRKSGQGVYDYRTSTNLLT